MHAQRRSFLLDAARLAAAAAAAPARATPAAARSAYPFSLGVASGAPLPDSVILWTRLLADPLDRTATPPVALSVRWEVAEDEGFRRLAAKGTASAVPALGHSVHVDVTGLAPGRWYWYRFMFGDAVSRSARSGAPAPPRAPMRCRRGWRWRSPRASTGSSAATPRIAISRPARPTWSRSWATIYDTREFDHHCRRISRAKRFAGQW
jgi:alkaline phosphatase D